jgi:CheY-like chemotaxis protein
MLTIEKLSPELEERRRIEEEENLRNESETIHTVNDVGLLTILVVEDTLEHRQDAIDQILCYAKRNQLSIRILTTWTASRARQKMEENQVDMVISDVYIPYSNDPRFSHAESPCGLNVVSHARERGIPVILCTLGNHHGPKLEWLIPLTNAGNQFGLPEMVSGTDRDTSKHWSSAFCDLYTQKTGEYLKHY